jgi:N-methylhydantoinase B/oxoprolinase/acetone carboxylase alpha subunit
MYSCTPPCLLPSESTRASHGPDEIHEYAFVIVLQISQVVEEVGGKGRYRGLPELKTTLQASEIVRITGESFLK